MVQVLPETRLPGAGIRRAARRRVSDGQLIGHSTGQLRFQMVSSCGSGTNNAGGRDAKPGMPEEESRWNH